MKFVAVAGTGGLYEDGWWHPDSAFSAFLQQQGITHVNETDVFCWSTDLDGVGWNPFKFFRTSKHADWEAGGKSLRYYLVGIPYEDRNIICHSHGLQVVLYSNTPIRSLVSVGSPYRDDMASVARLMKPKIGYWLHLVSNWDFWQFLGSLFDGKWGVKTDHPSADSNVSMPKDFKHSKILEDIEYFHFWIDQGWLRTFKNAGK